MTYYPNTDPVISILICYTVLKRCSFPDCMWGALYYLIYFLHYTVSQFTDHILSLQCIARIYYLCTARICHQCTARIYYPCIARICYQCTARMYYHNLPVCIIHALPTLLSMHCPYIRSMHCPYIRSMHCPHLLSMHCSYILSKPYPYGVYIISMLSVNSSHTDCMRFIYWIYNLHI